ncbi:MAG: ribosome-binding factor A [Betaproteobacteria bacterium SG8_39]|nr:MAG: ribosome-binding factor A [Betaproteobacteria bacterium SG8_39]
MRRRASSRRSGRLSRVGEQVRRELADILRRDVRDPRVAGISLTDVEISPDYAHAVVFFSCLDAAQVPSATEGLGRAAGFLRSQLAQRVKLYAIPDLRFVYDESIERGDRLSRLIDGLRTPDGD